VNITSFWSGKYVSQMGQAGTTTILPSPTPNPACLVMVQGTLAIPSGGGDHTVGAQYQVYANTGTSTNPDWVSVSNPVSAFAYAHADNSHVCLPMAFIPLNLATKPAAGQQICVTVIKDPTTLAGAPGPNDYYSIAVAELDQNVSV
jgi:hypothetical protein